MNLKLKNFINFFVWVNLSICGNNVKLKIVFYIYKLFLLKRFDMLWICLVWVFFVEYVCMCFIEDWVSFYYNYVDVLKIFVCVCIKNFLLEKIVIRCVLIYRGLIV